MVGERFADKNGWAVPAAKVCSQQQRRRSRQGFSNPPLSPFDKGAKRDLWISLSSWRLGAREIFDAILLNISKRRA
jgi:hypothetical protein